MALPESKLTVSLAIGLSDLSLSSGHRQVRLLVRYCLLHIFMIFLRIFFPSLQMMLHSIAAAKNIDGIARQLQQAVDDLCSWSCTNKMEINVDKTKIMLFGCDKDDDIDVKINNVKIEKVNTQKYLGVVLDSTLNFSSHVEYSVGKAKRAAAKVSCVLDGRNGIPVNIGIVLL